MFRPFEQDIGCGKFFHGYPIFHFKGFPKPRKSRFLARMSRMEMETIWEWKAPTKKQMFNFYGPIALSLHVKIRQDL